MKLNILLGVIGATVLAAAPLVAQESPAALAQREEMEANYRRVSAKVEQLEDTLQAQLKRMNALAEELHGMREELDRLKNRNENAATLDSIRKLAEKIEEVDRKRLADNDKVLAKLDALAKGLSRPLPRDPNPAPPPRNERNGNNGDAPTENMLSYKIKEGDTLSRIVTDLRAQGFKVTQKQITDANPGVNWSRLKIGQTILIPKPTP